MPVNNRIPLEEQNIILIGFMGVGKTTVGHLISSKLNREFIDVDQKIEEKYQMPITQIFKSMGEKQFRQMEKDHITDLCANSRLKVVSLGGGAFLQEAIRDVCLSTSIVIFLDLSWELWKDRLQLIVDSRPVLQNKSIEEIQELYYFRQSIYSANHYKISTDNKTPEEAADFILTELARGLKSDKPENKVM